MNWINIENLLADFKSRPQIKNKLTAQIIRELLEKKLNHHVKNVSFKNGRLQIKIKSPILLQELSFQKENLKKEINQYFKEEVVKEVTVKRY